jgi:mannose-6-phosphate isomerase
MMSTKNSIFKLHGKVQHYQWGGFDYIPQLLGIENNDHKPFAEYWLGAHENAASILETGESLNLFIQKNPAVLGEKIREHFGRLPYLLKILDVKDMLSIQVHPSKKSAETAFAEENKSGIAVNASNRNYKDDNHKPELMMALGEFWLLHGFRNMVSIKKIIITVPEFGFMLPVFEEQGYRGLYELLMTMEQIKVNKILQPLLDRVIPLYQSGHLEKDNPDFWAARAAAVFNEPGKIDRGIFSIYLFNIVHLKKGEAIFQDAGILHAYLEGQNVEIMANSDNVLRGGLTSKHIDVGELMKHVVFEPVNPSIIHGKPINRTEKVFTTSAPDFELRQILMANNEIYQTASPGTDIFLVLEGIVEVSTGETVRNVKQGEAFVAFSDAELSFRALADAAIYRASVPLQ